MASASTGSPRDRYRERTRAEIKEIALRQMAEGGTQAVALTRIAKEVGLSGPALYRYFAGRDDLLNSLVRDAYDDLAAALTAAERTLPKTPRAGLRHLAGALLDWAVAQPHRYLLIQGSPIPGYAAPPDTVERARAVLSPLLRLFARAEPSTPVGSLTTELGAWARGDESVATWLRDAAELPARSRRTAAALSGTVLAWSALHGTVSLTVTGHFTGMGHEPATLLDAQTETLAETFGLS